MSNIKRGTLRGLLEQIVLWLLDWGLCDYCGCVAGERWRFTLNKQSEYKEMCYKCWDDVGEAE